MPGNPKRKTRGSGGPIAKKARSKWSSTKFGQLVDRAGLVLGGDQRNLLSVDPALFQRQLTNEFRKSSTDENVVSNFMKGFREYLESPTRFKMSLLPTEAAAAADIRDRFGGLDSLVRLLLGVDVIQPLVADVLLEWLPDYMADDGDAGVHGIGVEEHLAMPKLILGQMRWLDNLVNGKDLCDKLLEVVEIAPAEMQREIIVALPEILDDPQHNDVAQKLKALLSTSPSLTAPIVDALSNLNIEKNVAAEVLEAAMGSLQSAEISDLPTVLKFIHEYMTPRHAQDVASEIRLKINLDFNPVPVISSTPRLTQPKNTKSSDYFVVLDTIRTSISFQKGVAEGWIKAISAVSQPEDHRVIDVFVLFVLYSISSHRKAVERLFVNKVRAGCFNEELMNMVFGSHPEALHEFFSTLLLLCDCLLCSSSPTVATFSKSLYCHLFESFQDICCQQEVVDSLVVHINNGVKSEVDHALDVLLLLLNSHCKIILRFESLIKTALDYLSHLSIQQIRKLYQILATLAFSDLEHTSSLQSEIHTIIRKQLTHFEPRYRHIGVIGSVMTIQQIAGRSDIPDSMSQTSHPSFTSRRQEMARTMLEEVMVTCSHSQECSVLFSDEMSCVVPRLDAFLLEFLGDQVTSKFQDTYLEEMADGAPQVGGVSMEYLYSLDTVDEGSIALNLFPMVVEARAGGKGEKGGDKKEGLVGMASQFHLLRKCELQMNGNLDGIDALLGCPVLLCSDSVFSGDTLENLTEVKRLDVCHSLFYCINWFRELVSAFAGESDIDMKGKVIIRLRNITDLQDKLGKCIAATPLFTPPSLTISENTPTLTTKGKSSKSDVTLASMTAATINMDKETTSMDKSVPTSGLVERLLPFFRPLDLSVFKAFQFGCLSRTMLDSELQTKEQEEVKLQVPQLIFLLRDLCSKLTSSFVTFGPKVKSGGGSFSFSKSDLVVTMVDLMPALCAQLESNSAYFQELVAENDGVVDMGAGGLDYPQYCLACHLLLKVFSSFYGWSSLSDPKFSQQLKSCLTTVVERIATQAPSSSLQPLAHEACKYFQKFAEFLPTLTCAHALTQVLVAICRTCKAVDARPSISRVCGKMLQHPWRASESSQLRNSAITYLLKYHIEWASDSLQLVEVLAGDITTELLGEEAVQESSKYPTLNMGTFPWFYRAMMTALVSQLKTMSLTGRGKQMEDDEVEDKFLVIQVSAKVFSILVDLVQSFSKRPILTTVLKLGKQYLEMFVRYAMPVLDFMLRPRKDDVISVLKTLQRSTRYLQHCCSHSKVAKDTNLINHVPQLKKSLEVLLFRVKELMASHNCQGAFWVGTLKNRDLKGQEILSQVSQQEQEGEEEDGEEEGEMKQDMSDEDESNSTSTRDDNYEDLL